MAGDIQKGLGVGAKVAWAMVILVAADSMNAPGARAATISAVAGCDYSQGPQSQLTRGVLGAAGADFGRFDVALAGVRYDDHFTGMGTSAIAAFGVPLHPVASLRAQATRFFGDEGYRAWRMKVGPQIALGGGRALLSYAHYEDDLGFASNAGVVESEIPITERWRARASGSYTRTPQNVGGMQAAFGLAWVPVPRLELAGELGLAQEAAASSSGPSRPLIPFLGSNEGTEETTHRFSPTVLLGIRISTP